MLNMINVKHAIVKLGHSLICLCSDVIMFMLDKILFHFHSESVCVCVCVCVLCVCVEDRQELELRGVCPRHLCVRPHRYTCTSIRAAIIDTWPTNYWF